MQQDELQQIIRFALSQLSAGNSQSDFEKICLYFSRARIHRNILPATGPVQAGGDQGRDFETFHSYLSKTDIAESSFVGTFSNKPVGFACSMEKNPTKNKGKIYSDVKTMASSGTTLERIYFFSGEDIPVGQRHKTQQKIKKEFSIELEIIDAQALSLHLTDKDLFWIAIQYLKISSESYPRSEEKEWYSELFNEYKKRENIPATFEEFADIKSAIRHIYKNENFKNDLLFWLPKLDEIIDKSQLPGFLKRKAVYEKFVASLIGLDNVEGQENGIEKYFSDFEIYTAPAELEDAQFLLSFCLNSGNLGRHTLQRDFLNDVADKLEQTLIKRLEVVENVDTRCALIEIYANFLFHDQRTELVFGSNFKKYTDKLYELIPLLSESHFFPIGLFLGRLNEIIDILSIAPIDLSPLEKIATKVDPILASKAGASILADKLRDRASNYIKKKLNFKALQTLHELKIKWYNQDTIKGSILTCLTIADTYRKMNLHFAAKYYSLIASYLAVNSKDIFQDLFIEGLSIAADSDYGSGSWTSFMSITDLHIIAHFQMTKDFDVYKHEDMHQLVYYPAIVFESSTTLLPEVKDRLENISSRWGFLKEEISELQKVIQEKFETNNKEKFLNKIKTGIFGFPFNDAGKVRHISFNAWGCDWYFKFENTYELNGLAEEFIAIFQVLLADLYNEELYIIPTTVKAKIIFKAEGEPSFEVKPSNTETLFKIYLSSFAGSKLSELQEYEFHYFVIAQVLLYEVSLLPDVEYTALIERKLTEENLIGKVTFGRPYEDLYRHLTNEDHFKNTKGIAFVDNPRPDLLKPNENLKLPWKKDLAKKYDPKLVERDIRNRIESLNSVLSISLPILKANKVFQGVISKLRKEGWLDWQILHTVGTIAVNYKAQFTQASTKDIDKLRALFHKDEKEWFKPIPPQELSFERIQRDLESIFVGTILSSLGLQFHSSTPNGKAIISLLKERFKFFEDGKDIIIF